jgi:hypothetical protein
MKVTLMNNFHNTETTVFSKRGFISARSIKRAEEKLCGIKECECGGIRGPQSVELFYMMDGSARAIFTPQAQ